MDTDATSTGLPPGVDPEVPDAGRMYDYFLGGDQFLPVDQAAAQRVLEKVPETYYLAHGNRRFVQKAASAIARRGVKQFVDVGSGIPTAFNTHEIVHHVLGDAPVVYVDNSAQVFWHGQELLRKAGETKVAMLKADVRDPDSILNAPEVRELIDFSQPVGMMLCAVMHFVEDEADPWGLVRAYMDAFPPGSYLALSHVTADGRPPEKVQRFRDVYDNVSAHLYFRTHEEIERMFTGAGVEYIAPREDAEPGLSYVDEWGSKNLSEVDPNSKWFPAGVAVKR